VRFYTFKNRKQHMEAVLMFPDDANMLVVSDKANYVNEWMQAEGEASLDITFRGTHVVLVDITDTHERERFALKAAAVITNAGFTPEPIRPLH